LTAQERADLVLYRGTPPISKVMDLRGQSARNVRVDSQGNILSATTPLPPVRTQKIPRPLSPSQRQRLSDSRLSKPNTAPGGLRGDLR
jgi:hypothetical protein